ncbi:hypothetical protein [Azospirillum halopraeferens]|uniref:hypothetical protein n=1 Tax=Azospirillum halopraeferens TaxID=34010 RepID=UPI0004230ED6|nr:hypothetical protein [Azospirillum halopraeferens]
MMVNFLIILVIVAVAAWLGNVLLTVEAATSQVRARVRNTRETVSKLEVTIRRLKRDEEETLKEIRELGDEIVAARRKQSEAQARLTEAQSRRRPSLIILSDRRNPSDKEWTVTVTNSQIREVDASHPLAQEWALGRDFLVWAESEREAGERARRRFDARPGYAVKAVAPAKEDLFPSGR